MFRRPHRQEGPAYGGSVLLLLASVVLGGATRAGYLSDVALQLASVPALLLAAWIWLDRLEARWSDPARWSPELLLGAAIAACGAVILFAQMFPLFGQLGWGGLSQRLAAAGAGGLEGAATGSSSIDTAASLAAAAGAIPALALFLLVSALDRGQRARLLGWLLVAGFLSLALGVLQVMQGPGSVLRFFAISNRDEAVGFFANRNHFAAQLYVTLLIGVAWVATRETRPFAPHAPSSGKLLWIFAIFSAALLLLAGLALARSRAGLLLALVAAAGIVAMAPTLLAASTGWRQHERRGRRLAFVAVAALLVLVAQLGASRFLSRFDAGLVDEIRPMLNATTLRAALDALPFGVGLGTFPSVYSAYEDNDRLLAQYVNRAHDDWLEFLLETGLAGAVLIGLFLVWFALRAYRLWVRPDPSRGGARQTAMAQCASLAVLLLLLHSFVDYPLRTAAMLAYFAACCALMTPARGASRPLARVSIRDALLKPQVLHGGDTRGVAPEPRAS